MYKICHLCGIRVVGNPSLAVDKAIFSLAPVLDASKTNGVFDTRIDVINRNCKDISKRRVDQIHRQVFGYGLIIDPRNYSGTAVRKSDRNATHDGVIIQCPIDIVDEDAVYQKLVDNLDDSGIMVCDIRVPVFRCDIPFVYKKYRPILSRFANQNSKVEILDVSDVFTSDEIGLIVAFCIDIGLDFGELDILRDNLDGRIYIVDVNPTPSGPPNHATWQDYQKAVRILSECFVAAFFQS